MPQQLVMTIERWSWARIVLVRTDGADFAQVTTRGADLDGSAVVATIEGLGITHWRCQEDRT